MIKKLVFISALAIVAYLGWQTVQKNGAPETNLSIAKGSSLSEISSELKAQDLISSELIFKAWAMISGSAGKLQAGDYHLPGNLSLTQLIGKLKNGEGASTDDEVKVLEGWTLNDIAKTFEARGITPEDFFALAGKPPTIATHTKAAPSIWSTQFPFLGDKPSGAPLEGYLFPDTYRLHKDATAEDVITKMLNNFNSKASAKVTEAAKESGRSAYDILKVASIVEAEVPHKDDRPIIAGIIWKRLSIGMGLQVDSSVNYVTSGGHASLTLDDLKIDSPYNTYKYRGLPPTPIGNPGLNAIEAAISPKESPYLYWLSAKDGTTIFSKTLDEHNAARAKYLSK